MSNTCVLDLGDERWLMEVESVSSSAPNVELTVTAVLRPVRMLDPGEVVPLTE